MRVSTSIWMLSGCSSRGSEFWETTEEVWPHFESVSWIEWMLQDEFDIVFCDFCYTGIKYSYLTKNINIWK